MAQPPDGRRPLPWEPPDPVPPAEAPTVAWTPPDDAAPPADAPTPDPDPVAGPLTPPDAEPSPPVSEEWSSQNPLISWTPSGGTTPPPEGAQPSGPGWSAPDPATGAPVVGWTVPPDARRTSPVAGFVVAGVGSRLVGYLVDAIILWLINVAIVRIANPDAFAADPALPVTVSVPMVLAQLIIMGIEFAYFVGFWTSRGRATIGMRLVRIQVIDARGDRTLEVIPAAARWLLLSGALGLIGLLPLPVGISGIAGFIWIVVLLVSVLNNPLRQGIHDQAAGSLVVQRVGVHSNVALVGCLLLALLFIVLPIVSLVALGSQMEEILREVGQSI